jgi:hypothetical protein
MRRDIIKELKQYFDIKELVCPHTYKKFGEISWQFFDSEFLENLLILRRDVLKVPLSCNDWSKGGQFSQRGFRCNICQLVKSKTLNNQIYLSAHCNGAGADFSSSKMSAKQMRELIKENQHLFTVPVRVERDVSWLHFDIYDSGDNKYTEFAG